MRNANDRNGWDVDELMREIREQLESTGVPRPNGDAMAGGVGASDNGASKELSVALPRLGADPPPLVRQSAYRISELLSFQDEAFVRNAYVTLLGREPDPEGASRYLSKLRTGELAKVEILGRIRYSVEGRRGGVQVQGLTVPFALRTLRRIPIVGYLLGIVQYVLRLPTLVRTVERLEATVFHHRRDTRSGVDGMAWHIERGFDAHAGAVQRLREAAAALERGQADVIARCGQHEARLAELQTTLDDIERSVLERHDAILETQKATDANVAALQARLAAFIEHEFATQTARLNDDLRKLAETADRHEMDLADVRTVEVSATARMERLQGDVMSLAETHAAIGGRFEEMLGRMESFEARIAETGALGDALAQQRLELLEQERRLVTLLDEAQEQFREGIPPAARLAEFAREREHVLDSLYISFEDRFRGSRDDIRNRVSIYIPHVRNAGAGTVAAPVLDLGCGRGEWLELLRDEGLIAQGVDSNRFAAAFCRGRDLSVVEADALEHLRVLQTGSVGAITAIHVIEHVPFERLVALFDEVRRVLRPGGIAIFETPNPENLVVGACNFYYDPTHVRPLPPEPMRFVVEQRGFVDVEILRLHPRHDAPPGYETSDPVASESLSRLFGAQDYAVIAHKRAST